MLAANAAAVSAISSETEEPIEEEAPEKLSSKYAILGISGRAGNMTVDVIDIDGQSLSLKVGSPLPSGHILSEIALIMQNSAETAAMTIYMSAGALTVMFQPWG